TLKRLPFYCIPLAAGNVAIPAPTPEDLAAATPNSKMLAKAEYSKKRMTSTSRSGGFAPSVLEGPSNRNSQGKSIMDDAVNTPIRSVSRSQAFTGPTHISRDPTGDAIDMDFFLFSPGTY
ncbi:hypothetical protein Tco_1513121, partial [Tanacetum coccineum]